MQDKSPSTGIIGLFVNHKAGNGRAVKLAEKVSKLLTKKGVLHSVIRAPWPDTLEQFCEIWIFGGDGTVNFLINMYPVIELPISIWPGGTGNDISWKIHGEKGTAELLAHLLQAIPEYVDAGICNGRLFLNGVGLGFDGEVLKSIRSIRFLGGHFGYLIAVLKNIFSYRETTLQVQFNDQLIQDRFLLVNISNASRTGGGFLISPLAEVNDGLLNLVLVKKIKKFKRLKYLPKIEKGKHLQLAEASHHTVVRFAARCHTEIPAQIDGELIFASVFDIKILPKKFRIKY